jgi:beta-glucosidase
MDLPGYSDELIRAVTAVNPRTAVVIQSGTPVTMPWADTVPSLIQSWYGGNEGGNAIADVLFGMVNPAGKLPLSIPIRLEDNPAFLNFGSENGRTLYGEDVYVGYRFYEKTKTRVLFPFGHGLSYTNFAFDQFNVKIDTEMIQVVLEARNIGALPGHTVAQVYISQRKPLINRPPKELKGFKKVFLKEGEATSIRIMIPLKYATSYWDEERHMWITEAGDYDVLVGESSATTSCAGTFVVDKTSWWKGL